MQGAGDRLHPHKLAIPRPARKLISRPRLLELLAGALDARLVLVSAPPGFGKSTVLADWLATSGATSAWISLDESDNDPTRFLRYLRAGVAMLVGGASAPLGEAPPPDDLVESSEELATLLATRADPTVLVLDDYHLIRDPGVQRLVGGLLERLPPQAHLVVSTRADPALPVARLRARGELLEIRADALRFTVDEARNYLNERIGLGLSDQDLETLVERTEGWPAVLQLAGSSLRQREDIAAGVQVFAATHRFVLDYVVEEVLTGLAPSTQDFLLRTSVLERLSGALCDAVTCRPGGQAELEALDRANVLILPLDDDRLWYRYHTLFANLLRTRLAALHPEDVASLHARASAWFEAQGFEDEAIGHALRSGDLDRACGLVADASIPRLDAGELSTVRHWLDALPEAAVRADAQLSAAYGWCLALAGETAGVADRLADADRAYAAGQVAGGFARPLIPAELALLRSRFASLEGNAPTAIAQARLARSLVPTAGPSWIQALVRGDASVMLAIGLRRAGNVPAAVEAYREAVPDLRAGGNVFALGRAIADLAAMEIARGHPAEALRLCEGELCEGAPQPRATSSPAVWAAMAAAQAALGCAELAEEAARRALELARRLGDTPSARSAEDTLARLAPRAAGRAGGTHGRRGPVLIEPLTGREVEVLRLVAGGRSNSQIASELFVTVGTVKAHLHTISGKLGAANRVEAVARGRESGILD